MYEYYECDMSNMYVIGQPPCKLEDVKVTNAVPVPGSVS